MRMQFSDDRVLAVVAHPDDAELLCAGTLARARDDGATIGICTLCQGDKGQPSEPIENLADVRQQEMAAAAQVLGAELLSGGFKDGQLQDGAEQRAVLVELFRVFRPTLVLAHWPHDYHADHRAAALLAEAVSWFSASPGHASPSPPLAEPPALWWMDAINAADFAPEFYIDVSSYLELKRRMLACHQSQLQRGSEQRFSALEDQMLQQCTARGAQAGVAAAEAFRAHRAWKRARAW